MTRNGPARIVFLASLGILLAACSAGPLGTSAESPQGSPAGSPVPPCPNLVDVVDTEPAPTDFSEDGPVGRAQERLRPDLQLANDYGAAHAEEFASVRFENGPRVRIVIGFTAHLAEHCAALRGILHFPEEFEIIRQPASAAQLELIRGKVAAMAGGYLIGIGTGAGTIQVDLRADGKTAADEIAAAYGDLVTITVGLLAYPAGTARGGGCPGVPAALVTGSPLVARATLETSTVRSGQDFKGTVRVTNTGSEAIRFESGDPMTALLLRHGSSDGAGGFMGSIAGVGVDATLEAGGTKDIAFVGGTASCDVSVGYAVPPGVYDVRVPVELYTRPDPDGVHIDYLLSDTLELTVTP